jgi:hypothetical protein
MNWMTKGLALTMTLALAGVVAARASVADIDSDGDNLISLAEMQAAYPTVSEDTFASADANGDAMIDEAELMSAEDAGLIKTE